MSLTESCTFRSASHADVAAITRLVQKMNMAEIGEPDFQESDLTGDWERPDFVVEQNTVVAEAADGTLVAYAWFAHRTPGLDYDGDVVVDPDLGGRGLEEALVARLERLTAAHASKAALASEAPTWLHLPLNVAATSVRSRYEACGYARVRDFIRMEITLDAAVTAPALDPGLTVRTCERGRDEPVFHAVLKDAFSGHYRFKGMPAENWIRMHTPPETHRPDLWFLVCDGARAVGALITFCYEDSTWVDELGVLASHRGRGIGRFLLLTAFEAIRRAGQPRVVLVVDAENDTGATRLYESVGMRETQRVLLYRKRIARS